MRLDVIYPLHRRATRRQASGARSTPRLGGRRPRPSRLPPQPLAGRATGRSATRWRRASSCWSGLRSSTISGSASATRTRRTCVIIADGSCHRAGADSISCRPARDRGRAVPLVVGHVLTRPTTQAQPDRGSAGDGPVCGQGARGAPRPPPTRPRARRERPSQPPHLRPDDGLIATCGVHRPYHYLQRAADPRSSVRMRTTRV